MHLSFMYTREPDITRVIALSAKRAIKQQHDQIRKVLNLPPLLLRALKLVWPEAM